MTILASLAAVGARRQSNVVQAAEVDGLRDSILAIANNGTQIVLTNNSTFTEQNATYVLEVPSSAMEGSVGALAVQRLKDRINMPDDKLCSPNKTLCADSVTTRDLTPPPTPAPIDLTTTTVADTQKTTTDKVAATPETDPNLIYYIIGGVGGAVLLLCCIIVICVLRNRKSKPKSADPTSDYLDENSHVSARHEPVETPPSRADLMIEFVSDLTSSSDDL